MEIDKLALGQRIKSIRLEKSMNLKEFGYYIDNTSDSIVSRWEKGKSVPNAKRLKLIATAGGITVDELLYGSKYEYAYKLFNDLYDKLDDSKKILSEEKRKEFVDDFLRRVTTSVYSSETVHAPGKFKEYVKFMFENHFEDFFTKEIVSNENVIIQVKSKLEHIQYFIEQYFSYDSDEPKKIIAEKLDSNLEIKLYDLIEDTCNEVDKILLDYKKD